MQDRLLRVTDIIGGKGDAPMIPMSKASFFRAVKRGDIPKPVKIGQSSFWRESDIVAVINR